MFLLGQGKTWSLFFCLLKCLSCSVLGSDRARWDLCFYPLVLRPLRVGLRTHPRAWRALSEGEDKVWWKGCTTCIAPSHHPLARHLPWLQPSSSSRRSQTPETLPVPNARQTLVITLSSGTGGLGLHTRRGSRWANPLPCTSRRDFLNLFFLLLLSSGSAPWKTIPSSTLRYVREPSLTALSLLKICCFPIGVM